MKVKKYCENTTLTEIHNSVVHHFTILWRKYELLSVISPQTFTILSMGSTLGKRLHNGEHFYNAFI